MTVLNYAPEMLEVFRRASREPVEIKLATEKAAIGLRFRFHNLRKAMREERHHMLSIAESVSFSVRINKEGGATLIAKPADSQFLASIRDALGDYAPEPLPDEEDYAPEGETDDALSGESAVANYLKETDGA